MKNVVLDGYTLNPGDLSWDSLRALGDCDIHDRTPPEMVVPRAAGAAVLLTNKTIVGREALGHLPMLRYIGVLASGYNIETRGLMNASRLALMKPAALLLNTSRGPLIEEAALAEALNVGRLAGAGLDVVAVEPPASDNPLLRARNCILTPHFGWATFAARKRLMQIAVENMAAFLAGKPRNVVN